MSRAARLLSPVLAALLAVVGVAGCGRDAPAAPAPATAHRLDPADLAALLRDSWVSDGTRGFFIDGAHGTASPAFSLYDTYWQLRLGGGNGVSAAAVAGWLNGDLDAGTNTSGLPAIVALDYAVSTLTLLHAPVDAGRVRTGLERLRQGGLYRQDLTAGAPDWGSTAVAVRLLTRLALPVPTEVTAATAAALAAGRAPTPGAMVALLETVADLSAGGPAGPPPPAVGALARAVEDTLAPATPDAAWLSAQYALRRAAAALHLGVPPIDRTACAAVVGADATVRLPGQNSGDPQATFYARELGCTGGRTPAVPPHAPAGWPTRAAVDGAPAASAAALRVADRLGLGGGYRPALARQLRDVWLRPGPVASTTAANLALLAAQLPPGTGAAPPATVAGTGDDTALLVRAIELSATGDRSGSAKASFVAAAATPRPGRSMTRAAWLALAGRLFDVPQLRAEAASEAAQLRIAPGIYAAGRTTATGPAAGSLDASAIGAWIERPPADLATRWQGQSWYPAADRMSWRTAAVVLAAQERDLTGLFPVSV